MPPNYNLYHWQGANRCQHVDRSPAALLWSIGAVEACVNTSARVQLYSSDVCVPNGFLTQACVPLRMATPFRHRDTQESTIKIPASEILKRIFRDSIYFLFRFFFYSEICAMIMKIKAFLHATRKIITKLHATLTHAKNYFIFFMQNIIRTWANIDKDIIPEPILLTFLNV